MSHWPDTKDWWILSEAATDKKWSLLPVYHPAARLPYADPGYAGTGPVLSEMIAASPISPGASTPLSARSLSSTQVRIP